MGYQAPLSERLRIQLEIIWENFTDCLSSVSSSYKKPMILLVTVMAFATIRHSRRDVKAYGSYGGSYGGYGGGYSTKKRGFLDRFRRNKGGKYGSGAGGYGSYGSLDEDEDGFGGGYGGSSSYGGSSTSYGSAGLRGASSSMGGGVGGSYRSTLGGASSFGGSSSSLVGGSSSMMMGGGMGSMGGGMGLGIGGGSTMMSGGGMVGGGEGHRIPRRHERRLRRRARSDRATRRLWRIVELPRPDRDRPGVRHDGPRLARALELAR